jgi:hypothetical protein
MHKIQRLEINVGLEDEANAYAMQNRLSAICQERLYPMFDEVLTRLSDSHIHVRFNKLELDLGNISLERNFEEAFFVQLKEKLIWAVEDFTNAEQWSTSESDQETPIVLTSSQSDVETLVFMVETGQLPWWANKDEIFSLNTLVKRMIRVNPAELKATLVKLVNTSDYLKRIIFQVSPATLSKLTELLQSENAEVHEQLVEMNFQILFEKGNFGISPGKFRQVYWQVLLQPLPRLSSLRVYSWIKEGGLATQFQFLSAFNQHIGFSDTLWIGTLWQAVFAPSTGLSLKAQEKWFSLLLAMGSTDFLKEYKEDIIKNGKALKLWDVLKAMEPLPLFGAAVPKMQEDKSADILSHTKTQETSRNNNLSDSPNRPEGTDNVSVVSEPFEMSKMMEEKKGICQSMVHQAGLVVLWPYLSVLFKKCELVQDKKFISQDLQYKAIFMCEYLCTRKQAQPEPYLVLPKLLCGLSLEEPLPASYPLTKADMEECEQLLGSVIKHWAALKKTSIEGFRQSFLVRPGILQQQEDGWELQVERKAYDMLLEKLPWGISMIKLPWMDQLLRVEW